MNLPPGNQEAVLINKYCVEAISDLEAVLQNKDGSSEPRIQALARQWWQKFLAGQNDMLTVGQRMESVYIALTRHMATRRTPAPADNREESQDRLRFKRFVAAFVEDLLYDWHPWATRQVKDGLKHAIAAGKNVPQSWENAELSLDRLEDTMLPRGDTRRSGGQQIPTKETAPPPCPPGFEEDAQGRLRPKRKPVPPPAFPRTAGDAVPPPCPTPPSAVPMGQPSMAMMARPPMEMGHYGAPPAPATVPAEQNGAGLPPGMELAVLAIENGMGRGGPA